jgi:hypothetical protein
MLSNDGVEILEDTSVVIWVEPLDGIVAAEPGHLFA